MSNVKEKEEERKIACEVCLKEIPKSVALSEEAADEVYHFCGADCYEKWKAKPENQEKTD